MRLPILLLISLLPGAVHARAWEEELVQIGMIAERTLKTVEELDQRVQPGRGFLTKGEVLQRYQDSMYLYMVNEPELAAQGFFSLITTAALIGTGYHQDAEWYYADCLYDLGNYGNAEASYMVIAEQPEHRFNRDAVRRLLEVYSITHQDDAFDAYYDRAIVRGGMEPTDLMRYSIGKSFFRRADYARAKDQLSQIEATSMWYRKARYVLGVVHVGQGELDAAKPYFEEVVAMSIDTVDARRVLDNALLALGRIAYEEGDFATAVDWYGRLGGDSEYLPDQLYEQVWSFIQEEEYDEALKGVEIFLIAFPDHKYAAQLHLVQGHLKMKMEEYDAALTAYEEVKRQYEPILQRFVELSESSSDPRAAYQNILALDRELNEGRGGGTGLPVFALEMIKDDKDLARAISLQGEIQDQAAAVEASEQLIQELTLVLGHSGGLLGFEQMRYKLESGQSIASYNQMALLEMEEEWLLRYGGRSMEGELSDLRSTRLELVGLALEIGIGAEALDDTRHERVDELGTLLEEIRSMQASLEGEVEDRQLADKMRARLEAEIALVATELSVLEVELSHVSDARPDDYADRVLIQFNADVQSLRARYATFRAQIAGRGPDLAASIDNVHERLDEAQRNLVRVHRRLVGIETDETRRIRSRLGHEVKAVARERTQLDEMLVRAEDVSINLTRAGFARHQGFFEQSVMSADMGIVDAYWNKKLTAREERERVFGERQELLDEIEARFQLMKEKLQ